MSDKDFDYFVDMIEMLVSKDDVMRCVHDRAVIANAVRMTLDFPEYAERYLNTRPAAVQECSMEGCAE